MEASNLFGGIWAEFLFQNTIVSNIGGIGFNNFEGIYCWNAKTRQSLNILFNISDNGSVNRYPRRRIFLKSIKKRLALLPKILIEINNIV
jgi:hypothetical protein